MKYRVIKNGFFVTDNLSNQGLLSEKEFFAKIDKSITQAEYGKTISLPKDKQKEFLGL